MTDKPTTPEPGGEQSSADRPADGLEPRGAQPAGGPLFTGKARKGMFHISGSGDTSGFGGLRLPAHVAAPSERPFGGWFDEVADELLAAINEAELPADTVQQITVEKGKRTPLTA